MIPEKQDAAFLAFYKAARYNKTLDRKTSTLVHVAAAMAVGCYP
ncbi:MAG: hypothetical protein ACYTHM_03095 [Planctomycetota bacterium]|jgi:hypothetical protein